MSPRYLSEEDHQRRADVAWGIGWGFQLAAFLGVIAIIGVAARVLTGSVGLWGGLRLLLLAWAIYLGGALIGGGIVGLLRSWTRRWYGAVVVGFLAAYPIALGGLVAVGGLHIIGVPWLIAAGIMAAVWSLGFVIFSNFY